MVDTLNIFVGIVTFVTLVLLCVIAYYLFKANSYFKNIAKKFKISDSLQSHPKTSSISDRRSTPAVWTM